MVADGGSRRIRARWTGFVACVAALSALVAIVPMPSSGGSASAEASSYLSLVPGRVLETRGGLNTVDGQFNGIGLLQGGTETALTVAGRAGVPGNAKAVVLNLAVTGSGDAGFVSVWPCGQPRPNASSLNYAAGQTISNAVTAQIGTSGQICIFVLSATHVIIDVTGAYPSTAGFTGLVPGRVLDTREGFNTTDGQFAGVGMREGGTVTELVVRNRAGAGTAGAVVLNVAVTGSFSAGFVAVYPCGEARPNAASLNYDAGQTISNAVTAKVGANGAICIYVFSATHVIVDLTGAFPAGAGYNSLVPGRVLETRGGLSTVDGQFNGIGIRQADTITDVVVAGRAGVGSVDAVVLNVAVTGSGAPGFVTLFPCGSPRPNASSLNFSAGQTISNAVTAKVGNGGRICIYVFAATHVIIDVTGFFPGTVVADPTTSAAPTTAPTTATATTSPPSGGGKRFQAVYMRAIDSPNVADAPDRIRGDIAAVAGWYDGQTRNRHPDYVSDAKGATVISIQLPLTQRVIAADYNAAALAVKAHPAVGSNYPVIFYEGKAGDRFCGVTSSEGYVLIPFDNCAISRTQGTDFGFPYGLTYLIAHEITHALGASNPCGRSYMGGGHVNDNAGDIIYAAGPTDFKNLVLDFGRNDYFDHGIRGCPDIKDSPLLTP